MGGKPTKIFVLGVLSLCMVVGLSACGTNKQAVMEAAEQIARASDQSVDEVLSKYSDDVLLESGDDIAREAARRAAEQSDQAARAEANSFMFKFSEDTVLDMNETRERYCAFLQAYLEEGSPESLYSLAMSELGFSEPFLYRVEDAISDLAEAVQAAEEGNGLQALIDTTCL